MNISNRGKEFEELVCSLLNKIGFRIVGRNYLLPDRTGEIDIICEDQNTGTRIAVECKSQETPVDVKELSWFADKMERLDIRHGILISRGKVSGNVYKEAQHYLKMRGLRIAILENVDRIVYESGILELKDIISRALNLSGQFVRKNVIFNEETIPKHEPEFLKAKYEHLDINIKLELRPIKLFNFSARIEIFGYNRKRVISGTGNLAFDLVTGRMIKERWFYEDLHIGLSKYYHDSYDFSILVRNVNVNMDVTFSCVVARVDEGDANEHIYRFLEALYSEDDSHVEVSVTRINSMILYYPIWRVHHLTLNKIRNSKLMYEHIYSGITGNEIFNSLFGSEFPPIWYCELCNEDEEFRTAYICHVCGRPICENHAIKCGDLSCERVFCEECVENEDAADYVFHCSAPECSIFCQEHKPKNICHICEEFFCENHSLQCGYCKSIVCEPHSVRCQNCGKVMCNRCKDKYSYEERKFWILKKYYCNECITSMEPDFR